MAREILLGDIGGTHLRFAWAQDGGATAPETLRTADFPSLEDAIRHLLSAQGRKPVAAAFAVAGIVLDGRAAMTNVDWVMEEKALARAFALKEAHLLNDFAAAALGVPKLRPHEVEKICGREPRADAPIGVIGPGTGLGVGGLVPDGRGGFIVISGEGGHVDLAASNGRELAILDVLLKSGGHVSAERVLCGDGLESLYRILGELDGVNDSRILSAAEIAEAARAGSNSRAEEAIALFTGWLGAVAGNLALTLGAHGGVYLAGGILPRWGALFDAKLFRTRFEDKGRMKAFVAPIPCYLVTATDLALRGLASLMKAP
ncbi:MAG: glucokinase [Alphaproteobacteria bacterium]